MKRQLSQGYENAILDSEDGAQSTVTTLNLLCDLAREILTDGDHEMAFRQCGIGGRQEQASRAILRNLEADAAPIISAELPTLQQLQAVYARHAHIPIEA